MDQMVSKSSEKSCSLLDSSIENFKRLCKEAKVAHKKLSAREKKYLAMKDSQLQKKLYSKVDKTLVIECIGSFLKDFFPSISIVRAEAHQALEHSQFHLPIDIKNEVYFIIFKDDLAHFSNKQVTILCLNMATLREYATMEISSDEMTEYNFWKDIFSKLPDPVVVFSATNEVIIHNKAFYNLGLLSKKCLEIKNDQVIELQGDYYRVFLQELFTNGQKLRVYIFIKNQINESHKDLKNLGGGELGIITSSLAHEINNPIAGIMAAFSYLKIIIDDEELRSEINEMMNSASRCQELVQLFLGFSRYDPSRDGGTFMAKQSFEQALSLMRFRLIENNMVLSMQYDKKERFSQRLHSPIFTMVVYLILGEVLTSYHHHLLISQEDKKRCLQFEVSEFSDKIDVYLELDFTLEGGFQSQKLIDSMLQYLRLKKTPHKKGFTFFRDDLRES